MHSNRRLSSMACLPDFLHELFTPQIACLSLPQECSLLCLMHIDAHWLHHFPSCGDTPAAQIASMKLISIKGIYVATLVYQLYRTQTAQTAPDLVVKQAAGQLQAHPS